MNDLCVQLISICKNYREGANLTGLVFRKEISQGWDIVATICVNKIKTNKIHIIEIKSLKYIKYMFEQTYWVRLKMKSAPLIHRFANCIRVTSKI